MSDTQKQNQYVKNRKMPINTLDSAWLSAEPDYTELQNTFATHTFTKVFELFNSGIRLANISGGRAKAVEYDLVSAGEALSLGYVNVALSIFYDVASIIEVSHGVKGFRTKMMNTITQEINQTQKGKKKGVFGESKEE